MTYEFSCVGCGAPIDLSDAVIACNKCNGLFCKTCAESTPLPNHNCIQSGDGETPVYDCDC